MIAFVLGLILLVLGYFFYGKFVAFTIQPDPKRTTPAYSSTDSVDFVPMPTWRIFLIQLLNIAGLGPVFGAIMGALWGPGVFLWVVLGCIFGGAVHDLLSGAMSVRNNGAGLPELIGYYLGKIPRHFATFFILILMILVGTVFVKGPADLIVSILPAETVGGWLGGGAKDFLTSISGGNSVWLWVVMLFIFLYYILATLLPIDKLIGRIYPIFGAILMIMVFGLLGAILLGKIQLVPFTLENLHPDGTPAWPIIFISVSCGAISGFHATQSPLMARCLKTERHMRVVFYGAMIVEGLIALVWAASASGYYGSIEGLTAAMGIQRNPGLVVHEVCIGTMGQLGGVLAVLGVVVLPITSGDTAFRAARLIVADYIKLPQKKFTNRYLIALPMFAISAALNFIPFGIVWRYFGWANQTLAAVTLWACAVYLAKRGNFWWLAAIPACFMTMMTTTYILVESRDHGCLGLGMWPGTLIGLAVAAAALCWFLYKRRTLVPEEATAPLPASPDDSHEKHLCQ